MSKLNSFIKATKREESLLRDVVWAIVQATFDVDCDSYIINNELSSERYVVISIHTYIHAYARTHAHTHTYIPKYVRTYICILKHTNIDK